MAEGGNNFQVAKVVIPFEVDPESMRAFGEQLAEQITASLEQAMQGQKSKVVDEDQKIGDGPKIGDDKEPEQVEPKITLGRDNLLGPKSDDDQAWTKEDVRSFRETMEKLLVAVGDTRDAASRSAEVIERMEPTVALGNGVGGG